MRIGFGYDVHRLVKGRRLILGGVEIPWEKGLLGHSDADVLTHALCDALLGAAALGDIGRHFPDNDPRYKDIDSLLLLARVEAMLIEAGFSIVNVDITIVAEKPRLAPYIQDMGTNIARVLELDAGQINIKATTTEGLGPEGRGESISAQAAVLIQELSGD
ncbi:MAG TPA: 2-C-methyl-D-erythritol 2,4-cyclodiphosphate synthase [Syntrophomonadaceae bacterium]|nr:2-C-methyl-D-erythritol 2,4-cyclodiphosphate synthase [Syntrophomonadaceae bacterium]